MSLGLDGGNPALVCTAPTMVATGCVGWCKIPSTEILPWGASLLRGAYSPQMSKGSYSALC